MGWRSRRALCALVAAVTWAAMAATLAPGAQGAFPGRNGLLVVQPARGNGLLLVGTRGTGARRICTAVAVCGHPVRPRFSPDGREIVFAGPAVRLIGTDGSCINCHFGAAANPAVRRDGLGITFVSGGAISGDAIDGLRQGVLAARTRTWWGDATDAVESVRGQLAWVSRGRVWITASGPPRSLGLGSEPSWSPLGSRIALVRAGWIVVVDTHGRLIAGLARGSSPAYSPDGRWVAFIGAGRRVEVIPAAGGRARPVGRITGLAVDWQPIPRRPPPACRLLPGATVLARSAQAIVTTETGSSYGFPEGILPDQALTGCLFADGRDRGLERLAGNTIDGATAVSGAALGGRFAAVVNRTSDEHYGGPSDSVAVFDLRSGLPGGHGGESTACDPFAPCSGIDQLVMGAGGVSAVHVDDGPTASDGLDPFSALTCASPSLCLADGQSGQLDVTTAPAAGPWTASPLGPVTAISCPSSTLCVAAGQATIYTSTDPAAGSGGWSSITLPGPTAITALACPTTTLCVASTYNGTVLVSSDPTGGAAAWTPYAVDGSNPLQSVACPASNECVATDGAGDIVSSTSPAGGAGAWTVTATGARGLGAIACPSARLCAAVTIGGVLVSTAPTTGPWTPVAIAGPPTALSCPSTSLCVAVGPSGTVDVSTAPASGAWSRYTLPATVGYLDHVSCPSADLCVAAGGGAGRAVVSADPTGGPSTWRSVVADQVACPPSHLCGSEQIIASDRTGVHTLDMTTAFQPQTGLQLTGLALSGDTLTWQHAGSPRSQTLLP